MTLKTATFLGSHERDLLSGTTTHRLLLGEQPHRGTVGVTHWKRILHVRTKYISVKHLTSPEPEGNLRRTGRRRTIDNQGWDSHIVDRPRRERPGTGQTSPERRGGMTLVPSLLQGTPFFTVKDKYSLSFIKTTNRIFGARYESLRLLIQGRGVGVSPRTRDSGEPGFDERGGLG